MSYDGNGALIGTGIQALSLDEIEAVGGGLVPIALLAAVGVTYLQVMFLDGVWYGIKHD